MSKRNLKISVTLFALLFILASGIGLFFYKSISSFIINPSDPGGGEKLFSIIPGQSLGTIAKNLKAESIISDPKYFILLARMKKADKHLQAGEYILSAANSPEEILEIFRKGRVKLYRLTIPEGLNIKEVAALAEKAGFCDSRAFIKLCHDKSFITSLKIDAVSLEGYLFPDTYFFSGKTRCDFIIQRLVARFNQTFTDQWKKRAKALGLSVHEVVTLASIIEKETGDASERPVISSVFHNRLKKRMRLESDPTVIYGIKDFDGNIKRKHLKMKTPYNTYQISGLPIGPIANPGGLSLKAALYPVRTKYIFFVSKKDTTHQFSRTLKEHNRAVRKYQLNK